MEALQLEGTAKTPTIKFSPGGKSLEISGRSIPENAASFYEPIYNWLDQYVKHPAAATEVIIKLEYFNTSSSKCLLDVFRKLETLQKSEKSTVKVLWVYDADDEDMREAGDDYRTLVLLPFELKEAS